MFLWIPELAARVNNQFLRIYSSLIFALEKFSPRLYMGGKEGSIYGSH
jgi:hypothetical protein